MPWFRVDDGFQRDPKVLSIPRPQRGPAIGLWTLAGTWSAANLTDGVVPDWLPDELGVPKRFAAALVAAGLWSVDGAGWRFAAWSPNQPTRAEVEAKREKRAAAGRLGGRASGASRRRGTEAPAKQSASDVVDACFDDVEPPARPGPARPVPFLTLVSRLAGGDARAGDASLPTELIAEWQRIAGPTVDLEREARAYLAHYADRPARNERSAWIGWLERVRTWTDASTRSAAPCPDENCTDGWLEPGPDQHPKPCLHCRPHLAPPAPDAVEVTA